MGSHHDHPVTENKPVAFRTPLILALVTVLAILLLVSTCDNKKCCCEGDEECKTECGDVHGKEHHGAEAKDGHHMEASAMEEHHAEMANTAVVDTLQQVTDTVKTVEMPAHH